MNGVLWTLYLADVVSSLGTCLGLLGFGAFVFAAGGKVFTAIDDDPTPPWIKPALIIGALCWATGSLLPSKQTLYAIAAVNAGDELLKTQTGDKAVRALNAWLDRQIAGEDEKK